MVWSISKHLDFSSHEVTHSHAWWFVGHKPALLIAVVTVVVAAAYSTILLADERIIAGLAFDLFLWFFITWLNDLNAHNFAAYIPFVAELRTHCSKCFWFMVVLWCTCAGSGSERYRQSVWQPGPVGCALANGGDDLLKT